MKKNYTCALAISLYGLCAALPLARGQSSVTLSLGNQGLSSLRYQNTEYLGYGDLRVHWAEIKNAAGQISAGSLQSTVTVDTGRQEVRQTYPWGVVSASYAASGNRLNITINVLNTSGSTIQGLALEPMVVRLPQTPQEYDGSIPVLAHNLGQPTTLRMTHGGTVLVLANEDVTRPLMAGFPWAIDRPNSMLLYPLRINTAREGMYPTSLPYIDRPIAPGASDQYRLSLRFAAASTPTRDIAGDVYQSFAALHPFQLNWPDRRAIGSLILATSNTGWPTNPRGWLLDPGINVTTPEGVATFRTRVLQWADNAVTILKQMNAQGMITWDIEGEQFPHATTYIGDPRLFATLAPEMAGVADEYFKRFRDAGLRVGLCIRPQQLTVSADGRTAQQNEVADPGQLMIDKIAFAKNRWGVTLFYVDSNGDPNLPMDISIFKRVRAAHPDVLLIPEHENAAYFSITAPYNELRGGIASSPAIARDLYPNAFSVINTADGPIDARYNDLSTAVRQGDVLMFRGWFADAGNEKVKSLYKTTGGDTTPPAISFTSPAANSTVSGSVTITAIASDNTGVAGVRFLLDGVSLGNELSSAPYSTVWLTGTATNGAHTLTAIARDAAGNTSSAQVSITAANQQADTVAPVVTFMGNLNNATVSGTITASVTATDNVGVTGVQFRLNGADYGSLLTNAPYTAVIDTRSWANSPYTLSAIAQDAAGNRGTAGIFFTIANPVADITAPVVAITAPMPQSTLSGSITVSATALDDVGVASVQFAVDGAPLGPALSAAPYQVGLDTRALGNGIHTLTVTARDGAGNTGGASITFAVNNQTNVADTQPPSVRLLTPANNVTINGVVTLTADAADNTGIASVRYYMDGVLIGTATQAPFAVTFDSHTALGGMHYFTAEASDLAGNSSRNTSGVSISNRQGPDCGSVGTGAFVGCYYGNADLTGLRLTRLDQYLNFDWGGAAPDPAVPADQFSVRWQGAFGFESSGYLFEIKADDGFRLYIDDVLVSDHWTDQDYHAVLVPARLTAGTHRIKVEYREAQGGAVARLGWWKQ